MSDPIVVALIVGILGPVATLALQKALGSRRDSAEVDALLSERWEAWSNHQDKQVSDLRVRVDRLEADLISEREKNRKQASLMTKLIGWALQLRDEIIRLDGHPPPAPPEVQAALTSLDPT